MKTIFLIDANSLCYRSFHAIKLSTKDGFPTGAIYGVVNSLNKIIKEFNPQYIAACFDVSRKTFRQKRFSQYKVNRPPVPRDLSIQMPLIKEFIGYMGITIIEMSGVEADDVIATLVKKMSDKGNKVVVVTEDKDIWQIVRDDNILIFRPTIGKILERDYFLKEYGFAPEYIVDYLALVGDNVDNIPGARGIGKVSATELIKRYKTVENIFSNISSLPPRLKEIIIENKENIYLSKELVLLSSDLDIEVDLDSFRKKDMDTYNLFINFKKLEFYSLIKELPDDSFKINIKCKDGNISDLKKTIVQRGFFPFSIDSSRNIFIYERDSNVVYRSKWDEFIDLIDNHQIIKVVYDLKHKIHILDLKTNIESWFDVMIAAYSLDASLGDYSLSNLCMHFLNILIKDNKSPVIEAYLVDRLYDLLKKEIETEEINYLFYNVEMPLIDVLANMERVGIKIDINTLDNLIKSVEEKINHIREEIFSLAGEEFNLNSPKQLSHILFEKMKLPAIKRTKTGFSTNEEVLKKLAKEYKIAKLILEHRHFSKIATTYLVTFLEEGKKNNSRIFSRFNQVGTQTGRLSSDSPNLQNIPIRGDLASSFRRVFIPSDEEGYILSADYSQIELRVLAHFSQDTRLIEAFSYGRDIHCFTASLLFNKDEKDVDIDERNIAKRINFGIVYGMSEYGLSKELDITFEEAKRFIEEYFLRYPNVKKFIDKIIEYVKVKGYVKTLLGRKRYIRNINSVDVSLRELSCRQAVNTVIQGSAADIIKIAMVNLYRRLKEEKLKSKIIIQVHDELVIDVDRNEANQMVDIVRKYMESAFRLKVPLKVNIRLGRNWQDMENID